MHPIISVTKLRERFGDDDVVICDCRYSLDDQGRGGVDYARSRIPGAIYVSLDMHLTGPLGPHGGRHPLPAPERLADQFSALGITQGTTHVVAYDDGGGAYASRLWWLLRWMGHDRVQVLDGGWDAWCRDNAPLELRLVPELTQRKPAPRFTCVVRHDLVAAVDEVRAVRETGILFDARAADRFHGENEVIDPIAGHVPGARNLPWQGNLDATGHFLSVPLLAARYAQVPDDAVMMCGSGVTACVNVLAMVASGRRMPRLYAGSWSDWITWPDAPVATR
jgi:thiosulfate/3-mercaptopyruvate sulfurtransferase